MRTVNPINKLRPRLSLRSRLYLFSGAILILFGLNVGTSLWGSFARKKKALIDPLKHHILESVHPSGLSAHRGFFGCKHFSAANQLLEQQGKTAINWHLPKDV